ncbi:MAG: cation transporter [Anaerolineae bacterium]|nr:heavy-metal-associated domain-containing protein [Promineifilum sp.]MCZ2113811.1 cation transporter [Anaerolineae bacterium]HNS38856.1 heavy-metal-associated domain-containing protein [Promineifilum sp.]
MKTILRSQDLSCPSCVAKIEKALKSVTGVEEATVHFNTGRIVVEHDSAAVKDTELIEAIRSVGYEAKVASF